MNRRASCLLASSLLLLLPLAAPALASDGRFELSQVAAIAGTPQIGDVAPGYPITITQPGSYILTSDLIVPPDPGPPAAIGIQIEVSDVTLDLNGFSIVGDNSAPLPGYLGVATSQSDVRHVEIRNGTIRNFSSGVKGTAFPWRDMRLVDLRLIDHTDSGAVLDGSSEVVRCYAGGNGAEGINIESGLIVDSIVVSNGIGIFNGFDGVIVRNSVVKNNNNGGIFCNYGCVVSGSQITGNTGDGIVSIGSGGSFFDNTISFNTGYGLSLTSTDGYARNVIVGNVGGTVSGTPVQLGTNLCGTNTTCP